MTSISDAVEQAHVSQASGHLRGLSAPAPIDLFEQFLLHGSLHSIRPETLLLLLASDDPHALERLFRHHARNDAMLRCVTEVMSSAALERLLTVLEPEAAAPVLAYMIDIRSLHRAEPIVPLSDPALERLLWHIALRYILREAGTQFDHRSFVATAIEDIAIEERLSYREVLGSLRLSVAQTAKSWPPATFLTAVIDELAVALEPVEKIGAALSTPALIGSLTIPPGHTGDSNSTETNVHAASQSAEPIRLPETKGEGTDNAIAELYARLDQFRHFLRTGALPWRDILAEPKLTPQRLVALLGEMRPGFVRAALAGTRAHRPALRIAVASLADADIARVTGWLLQDGADARELSAAVAAHAVHAVDRDSFYADVIAALIEGVALDLEHFAATSADREGGAAIVIVQMLLSLLARGSNAAAAPNEWQGLLARLVASDPRAARRFLANVVERPGGLTRLAERCTPPFLQQVLPGLVPAAAPTLAALTADLIALDLRPGGGPQDVVAAVLDEAIAMDPDAPAGSALVTRLLRRLFGESPPPSPQTTPGKARSKAPPLIESETHVRAKPEGVHAEWLFRALADRDLSGTASGAEVPELLSELLSELVQAPQPDRVDRLVAFLHRAGNRADLFRLLPERLLARLIVLALPRVGRDLLQAGELLAEAASGRGKPLDRATLWEALLATAAAPAGERTVLRLAEHVFAAAGRVGDASRMPPTALAEPLLQAALRRARDAGHAALVHVLSEQRDALVGAHGGRRPRATRAEKPVGRARLQRPPIRARTAFNLGGDDGALDGEPIYIGNAGLALANPFLPQLFDVLGLMVRGEGDKPHLRDEEAASRAVHLLQYLVDGRIDRPEPLLVLNKLLCGLPVGVPVERSIEATDAERDACEMLLRSMIENWPIVRGTSIAGLRETFLQRDGKLTHSESGWRLQVQRKTLDVLVDQLPWSIGVVFHPWMPGALHVTW